MKNYKISPMNNESTDTLSLCDQHQNTYESKVNKIFVLQESFSSANSSDSSLFFKAQCRALVALIGAMAILCSPAFADDPCSATNWHVTQITKSLEMNNQVISKSAIFRVQKRGDYGVGPTGLPSYVVSYEAMGKKLFRIQFDHPSKDIADVFLMESIHTRDGAKLGVGYSMGAGGAISCEYKIFDSGGRFFVKHGKW